MPTGLNKKDAFRGVINSLGLVFGDIGTSPIYTLTVIFLLTKPTEDHVIGILSLIVWTLVLLVSIQYAWLAMSLGKRGEGGTIVLKEILLPLLKSGRRAAFFTLLSYIGVSLLIGDGIITPAISILSAVEGILMIPGFEKLPQTALIATACLITMVLFFFQNKGTERVAGAFGPFMIAWFAALLISGMISIYSKPVVLKAVNPYYAIKFLWENGMGGFFVLSEVILCATGGEALYADMGHLGRKPILRAWHFVFVALLLNYLGQGAYVIHQPESKFVLFEMVFHLVPILYVPFLILSIIATVIASQAMISGIFSIVYQGITTHIMPLFRIDYTSSELRSQIYINTVNWFLFAAVIFIIFEFKESRNLAAAYGLAVTGTMTITGIMMTWIYYLKGKRVKAVLSALVTLLNIVFLLSNGYKIPHGGYWSLILAAIPLSIILIYTNGQKRLHRSLRPMTLETFLKRYNPLYAQQPKITGTGLFFVRDFHRIPPYMVETLFVNNIIYEDNIIVSIIRVKEPFGVTGRFRKELAEGLRLFEIQAGYMEVVSVEKILRKFGIEEKAIFYGTEDIFTTNFIYKVFVLIKKLSPSRMQFYKLPYPKLHGVVTRVDM